jgi:hypothetical protein
MEPWLTALLDQVKAFAAESGGAVAFRVADDNNPLFEPVVVRLHRQTSGGAWLYVTKRDGTSVASLVISPDQWQALLAQPEHDG